MLKYDETKNSFIILSPQIPSKQASNQPTNHNQKQH